MPSFPSRVTLAEAAAQLPSPDEKRLRFATLLQRGSLRVVLYAPQGQDPQTPHPQDEVYVVVSGRGEFINGEERYPFGPGDVLFVPANRPHRFENFTADFQTWAVFYGPQGGEQVEESA
jgi:mannose-6-phosphate isomerase-like protein (cupin superfamily)